MNRPLLPLAHRCADATDPPDRVLAARRPARRTPRRVRPGPPGPLDARHRAGPQGALGSYGVPAFSPDGQELLAVGDDQVVRVWPRAGKDAIDPDATRVLRWPIYCEQVGAIYAMALSPDDGGKRVAIGEGTG
ncbi:MAG: hypothetical protein U0797_30155 [Gemmataceae bacterium]